MPNLRKNVTFESGDWGNDPGDESYFENKTEEFQFIADMGMKPEELYDLKERKKYIKFLKTYVPFSGDV